MTADAGVPAAAAGGSDGQSAHTGTRRPVAAVDQPRIERAIREILAAIGEDPGRDGLRDTPARVARAYA